MRLGRSLLCVCAVVLCANAASALRYADVLVDHSPVCDCPGSNASQVLGPPDFVPGEFTTPAEHKIVQFSQVDPVTPGFVTVGFSGHPIPDKPGDDITFHLVDWSPGRNQTFEVFASLDGVVYLSIGESGPPTGDEVEGGFPSTISFDLSVGGLLAARFVRLENTFTEAESGQLGGVPIDAITAVPEPTTASLLGLGMALMARRRALRSA